MALASSTLISGAARTSSFNCSCSSAAHVLSTLPCSNASAAAFSATQRRICRARRSAFPIPLRRRPVTRSAHLQTRHHAPPASPPSPGTITAADAPPAMYTSMRSDPLAFWDSHPGLLSDQVESASTAALSAPTKYDQHSTGGVVLEDDVGHREALSFMTDAQLRLLSTAALDRAEMHSILAQQRDNWNKLFQRMLTSATMTACVLSGLNGQAQNLISLSLPALVLNAGSAAMMAIINQFQPSQLAEEQRTAARLFRKLASDIDYALHVAPHLRTYPPLFLRDCRRRLQALDKAFPMPLTPGGLEKFPAKVVPPTLIEPLHATNIPPHDHQSASSGGNHVIHHNQISLSSTKTICSSSNTNNGWDEALTRELQGIAALLNRSDIPKYTGWAQNLAKANKCFAILAPLCAVSAALLNAVQLMTPLPSTRLGLWAAVCSVVAAFASSLSNDMQLGMIFELYRNSAGYYLDVKTSIEETLRMPMEHRENGALFRQRVAYQLGRSSGEDSSPMVPPDAEEAGMLF